MDPVFEETVIHDVTTERLTRAVQEMMEYIQEENKNEDNRSKNSRICIIN
jgi:hypothetical protein